MAKFNPKTAELHLEPSVRNVTDWTPPLVQGAIRMMFDGNYAQAGLLADAVLGDMRIQSVMGVRGRAMAGLPLEITHPDDQVVEALDADIWRIIPEDVLTEWHERALLGGACLAQLEWDTSGDRWIPRISPWHLSLQRYDTKRRQWFVKSGDKEVPVTPGDGQWVLYSPGGRKRPWAHALLRGLGIWYAVKRYTVSDWSSFNEVHGRPIRVAEGAQNEKEADRMAADLSNLGSDTTIALTSGRTIKLVEAVSQSWRSLKEQGQIADTEIAVGVLGQNLTTEVSGGSLAAANVHDQIRHDLLESDVEGLATCLHEQVLPYWTQFNFGAREVPWAQWDASPPEQQPEIFQYHLEYGIVKTNEVRERLGLPPLEEGGDEVPRPLPAPGTVPASTVLAPARPKPQALSLRARQKRAGRP